MVQRPDGISAGLIVVAGGAAVLAVTWMVWLLQVPGVAGSTTLTTAANDTITVVFVNRSNLSTLPRIDAPDETHDTAAGVFRREWIGSDVNYTMFLATARHRAQILQTCSHEMDHYWYHQEQPGLTTEEQHRLIEEKYRVSVLSWEWEEEAFWKWRRECLRIIPHLH